MATSTATLEAEGKKEMLSNLSTDLNLTLVATGTSDAGPVSQSQTVAYDTPVISGNSASTEISADVTFTFTSDNTTITSLVLVESTTTPFNIIEETLTTNNEFPFGGDLIVKSFKVTIT